MEVDPRGVLSSDMAYVGKRSLGFPLVHLPGNSRGEDRLPMHMEGIRMQKYLEKKLLPPH